MKKASTLIPREYVVPFVLITTLFFLWGFARAILDVLNKHFQETMDISITRSTMVQATTYAGYFLMALPAGIIITRWGYRRGVVLGLLLFGLGSLLFIPGQGMESFEFFLGSLFVIGCGLAVLETAANPYAAMLGPRATAASRLNLAQSFNGLGCILAPVLVGGFLFSREGGNVAVPYTVMGIAVLLIALVFTRVKLPEVKMGEEKREEKVEVGIMATIRRLWGNATFRIGVLALLSYEVAEISINSLFINYVTADGWMDKTTAAAVLSFGALGLFMGARVIGSMVMSRVAANRVLCFCAVATCIGALAVMLNIGVVSRAGLFVCYAFEAIMFPTIFAITISAVGASNAKIASSFLMMTPIGGAIGTFLMGVVADATDSMSLAFGVPLCGYLLVLLYAVYTIIQSKQQ